MEKLILIQYGKIWCKTEEVLFFFDKWDIYFLNVKRFGEKKIKGSFFGQMDIFLLYLITNLSEKMPLSTIYALGKDKHL